MEALGKRIRRLREERGWTQAELGDLIGTSGKTIGNWENARHIPRNRLGALEKAFGASLTEGETHSLEEKDQVVRAIEGSLLNRADRAELISHYWRLYDAALARREEGSND